MVEVGRAKGESELKETVSDAVERAQGYFLRTQHPRGYWWGELESNSSMEAEFILLNHFLGTTDEGQRRKLVNYILKVQRPDGTWGQYYGAPGDLSTSVECYFALKLSGLSPEDPRMVKAREFILSRGGVPRARIFTKIWLALFGQWDWQGLPAMPPELMLLPNWFPINIYEFSSWARATIVPLLIVMDVKPVCPIPDSACIDELYSVPRSQVDYRPQRPPRLASWKGFFWMTDILLRLYQRLPWKPGREQALRKAESWMLAHQEADGSWGGIQPPWVYSLLALKVLGYGMDHPAMAKGLGGFQGFAIEEGDTLRVQACLSPVWDTCLAMIALEDSGLPPDHPALQRGGPVDSSGADPCRRRLAGEESQDTPRRVGLPSLKAISTRTSMIRRRSSSPSGGSPSPRSGSSKMPSTGGLHGCWGCRAVTAVGPPSTRTTPALPWPGSPSVTLARSWTLLALTSPRTFWRPWGAWATPSIPGPSSAVCGTSWRSRRRTAPGSDAGG